MKTGQIVKELIESFQYKKPLVYVERTKSPRNKPPGAILDVLFFWDQDICVVVQFYIASDGAIIVEISPTFKDHTVVYEGKTVKDAALAVINWLTEHTTKTPKQ